MATTQTPNITNATYVYGDVAGDLTLGMYYVNVAGTMTYIIAANGTSVAQFAEAGMAREYYEDMLRGARIAAEGN